MKANRGGSRNFHGMGNPVLRPTDSAVQTSSSDDESDHSDFFESEPLLQVKSESPPSREFHVEGSVPSSDDEADSVDSRESTLSFPSEATSVASPPSPSARKLVPAKQLDNSLQQYSLPSLCQVRISSPFHSNSSQPPDQAVENNLG